MEDVRSVEFDGAFVTGPATKAGVQIMVKDSKQYASTGGWGFSRFIDGKLVEEAPHKTCLACHEANERARFGLCAVRALRTERRAATSLRRWCPSAIRFVRARMRDPRTGFK
jgi:hypothetical protein